MVESGDTDLPPVTGEVTELLFRALDRREDLDVEALCRARPEHAEEIRRRFGAMRSAVEAARVAADGAASADAAWRPFLDRLRAGDEGADRYRDEGELARGGMGVVRRVFDRRLRRPIALKRILDRDAGAAAVGRFLEEAQVAGQLDHPGIVPVHELGVDADGRLFFTMKLVEGEEFGDVLARVRRGEPGWTRMRALAILLRASEAVAYAHAKGVVHRDLKPSNIMVGRFGETYVMDWGLARIVGRVDEHDLPPVESMRDDVDPASPLRTMAGEAVGTPFFMAPEQAQGRLEAIGPATDVYAMGCVLYRLLTGLHPYEEAGVSTSREVLDALLTGPPARPRRLDPDVPPELEAICERAMDRRVDRRYATMAEFADDLRAFQENRVVRAHATGPWAEFVKWVARNRAVARTAAFAVVALIGSTAFFVARIDRERRAAEESAEVAREVNAFLTDDLLAAVRPSPEEGRGRDVTMREVLDEASRRIEGRFEARPAVEAAIRRTLGSSYLELGEPAAAEPHFRRAAVVESARYGPGSAEALAVNNFLAMTLHDLGRYDEAERLLRSIAGAAAAALGEDHPEVLTYRSNLSVVLRKRGRLDEAAEIELDVLGRRSSRGELSSAVLTNLNGLALLHYRAGRYDEAEGLLARVVREAEASLGPYAPETLTYAQNLAGLYVEQGRGDEAEEIFVRALEGMSDVLGPDHGQTLNVSRNYAGLLRRRQRFEEAEARYREALERYRAAYGPGHVDTVGCLRDFAVLLLDRGRADEAMPLLEEALESQRRVFGPNHESTLSTLSSLAVVQYRRGRVEEAGARFEELLARRREVLGDDHPSTLTSMENLIAFHLERGASAAASALARELLERTPLDDARRAVREALLERARAGREDDD